jgi:hypothetical protein
MTTPYIYRAFGLIIASELEIPGGVSVAHSAVDADVVIRVGACPIGPVETVNGPYSRSGEALLFDAAGVARYAALASNQLWVESYPKADSEKVIALLVATALPMLIWMRGDVMLHAAGVVPAGSTKAIAIAGPSGVGKSTLASGLIDKGGRLVGDDSLKLTVTDRRTWLSGLSACIFAPNAPNARRTAIALPKASQMEIAPLAAIICLKIDDAIAKPEVNRLQGADALEALLKNRHRPKIPAILGRDAELLSQWILHCRMSPIYELRMKTGDVAGSQQHIASVISDILRSG